MKMVPDGHDLAQAQLPWPQPGNQAAGQLSPLPNRLKLLAKIIDMAEQFN